MKSGPRVFITGMGAVSALGLGVSALWHAARDGRSGVCTLDLPRTANQLVRQAAHLSDFNAAPHFPIETLRTTDRFAQMALLSAREALADAGWPEGAPLGPRTAVIIGSGIGGASTSDIEHYKFYQTHERADPMTIPKVMPNAAASHVSMAHGAQGLTLAVSSACSSANQAIGLGMMLLRQGLADRAIVGGSECLITPATFRAWETLRVMTQGLCRPFSAGRDGMVLGEGAGLLVLETEAAAQARHARPHAELAGYGTTSDAGDIVRPNADGAARAMETALADAGLQPSDIHYVNAHGTGTVLNDRAESEAMWRVFGPDLGCIAVSSTKPVHGHALGAAGALEMVVTVCAMRDGVAPPTINWTGPEKNCIPDPVPNMSRSLPIAAAMSNSFAFGGINASLVIRKA
ncbi:beta-ketoacyl-[acyl-carrier-protein] synthase family protein [Aestuariivirga sp.]|uniref:beta-ketoacyl-[acyl-carrier-protein] synthase family protein n=1 Tax=Aestuariivirga sp. TaxID=2650926 RepID=UPI003BAB1BAC